MSHEVIGLYKGAALDGTRFAAIGDLRPPGRDGPPTERFVLDVLDAQDGRWTRVASGLGFGEGVSRWPAKEGDRSGAAALNRRGKVWVEGEDVPHEVYPDGRTNGLTELSMIGESVYAIGGAGHFFCRGSEGVWKVLSKDVFQENANTTTVSEKLLELAGFEDEEELDEISPEREGELIRILNDREAPYYVIGGSGPSDLYIGGTRGALLHFDGEGMTPLVSNVSTTITGLAVDPEGVITLSGGGRGGSVVIQGNRQEGFTSILPAPTPRGLHAYRIASFQEQLYIADPEQASGGLYCLQGGRLDRLSDFDGPVWHVAAVGEVLWTLQAGSASRFDGSHWEYFPHPDS